MISSETTKPAVFQEVYALQEPYVYAAIVKEKDTQKIRYQVIEPTLQQDEEKHLHEIKNLLMEELDVNLKEIENKEKAENYLKQKIKELVKKYRIKIPAEAVDKLTYYIIRDFTGYGKIDPLMKDPLIEDISADGVNIPLYVWHRLYESLPTNIMFTDAAELDSFVIHLAYLSGKNISIATPILDASLPDGSRIQITYGREVTKRGSTFTIRRFKTDPLTISDLIAFKTISSEMAAYLWVCLENRASVMVLGGTAAGKTTALNALGCLIKPGSKIMTIEETAELNLSHENWVSLISRQSYGLGGSSVGEVALFDLVKTCMRHRPDLMIVGEVRGQEAYVLFQALATGHGGMCTMHAENVQSAVRRLTQKPMDISPAYIPLMNIVISVQRVHLVKNGEKKAHRRILSVNEIVDAEKFLNPFKWDPIKDQQTIDLGGSFLLGNFSERLGITREQLLAEMNRRTDVLHWMRKGNIRSYKEVASIIAEYYARPKEFYRKIMDTEEKKIVAANR